MIAPLLVALLLPARQAPADPQFVQTAIELRAALDYDTPAVDGTALLTLENRGRASAPDVSLLLNRLMTVRAVSASGRTLPFEQAVQVFRDDPLLQVNHVRVQLRTPVGPGERVTIEVSYGGPLVGYTETGSLYIKDHIDPAFTILRRDAYAFPVAGVLSSQANRSLHEPEFSYVAAITVPHDQVVAAGGELVAKRDAGGGRVTWEYRSANSPFLNIAIAPFVVTEANGIRINALPGDAGAAVLDATRKALALLTTWYGPLDRAPRLTITEIPEGYGSQASLAGGVILDRAAFLDPSERRQLYHELSHIWNAVDLDQPSPRWNEGLAMYLQYRLSADIDGYTGLEAASARIRTRVCEAAGQNPLLRSVPFDQYGKRGMTDYSYTVGFLMFTDLERLMSRSALDAGLRAYFQDHQSRGGTTAELEQALQRASPVDLTAAWQRWMTGLGWVAAVCPGVPH